jgi:STE24 endopeptidase
MLFALVLGLVLLPLESWLSRRFEREADRVAIELTQDPTTAVRTFRRLAFSNLADLRPHPAAVAILFSHPPIPQRIASALSQGAKSP